MITGLSVTGAGPRSGGGSTARCLPFAFSLSPPMGIVWCSALVVTFQNGLKRQRARQRSNAFCHVGQQYRRSQRRSGTSSSRKSEDTKKKYHSILNKQKFYVITENGCDSGQIQLVATSIDPSTLCAASKFPTLFHPSSSLSNGLRHQGRR